MNPSFTAVHEMTFYQTYDLKTFLIFHKAPAAFFQFLIKLLDLWFMLPSQTNVKYKKKIGMFMKKVGIFEDGRVAKGW